MDDKIDTTGDNLDKKDESSADLDQALDVVGVGSYNIKYCGVLALFLIAVILEPVGYSFVLPAAKCDLDMSDGMRGFIGSVPYIGIVITSFPWGYLVDTQGRKKILIYSSLFAGLFGILSAFMPDLISFTIFKVITSLCMACPAAVPYTYMGEILPAKYRDVVLSITNALQITGAALVPLLAWAILPLDFRADFGSFDFRPWRLLTIIYASSFILSAVLLAFGPESPKYLVSQGKFDEALNILQVIYASNQKKALEVFPIKKLRAPPVNNKKIGFLTSLKIQSWPLLKPPYLKWMALNGFLLFGLFAVLNGLYVWVPDLLNRVLTGEGGGKTACEVISDKLNQTTPEDAVCNDTIDRMTFLINSVANVSCAVVALIVSGTVQIIGKKTLLIIVFVVMGTFCILLNVITQDILFAAILSSFRILALAIGPVNAYSVEIFPTHLRGMAVSLSLMIGRAGSVMGANVAGVLINLACEATFYSFGALLLLCGALSFILPNSKGAEKKITEIPAKINHINK